VSYQETVVQLKDYRRQLAEIKTQMRELQAAIEPEPVADYRFANASGTATLSELFGNKNELFVIHNMGKACAYCTLWADGFNGVQHHLRDRAAFVVSSPDSPEVQAEFARSRGWLFPMVSHQGNSFAEDMGYRQDGKFWPGVSVFRKQGDGVVRISDAELGPDDEFCVVWSFLDLLGVGTDEWRPRYSYE
jgi:predicted dithiol-disulfide oxidoreductase (DUF899 family)